jgi:hypothetical protein
VVTFRFTVFKEDGSEEKVEWSFEETKNRRGFLHTRDEEREAGGRFRRRAYLEQKVLRIQVPAGVLQITAHNEKFEKFLRAETVEIKSIVNTKEKWTRYTPDLPNGEIEFEYVNDLDPFETYTFKLIETEPRDFRGWM